MASHASTRSAPELQQYDHIPVRDGNGPMLYLLRYVGDETWVAADRPGYDHSQPGQPMVYFIGGDTGAIKIGFTTRLAERLSALRHSSPIPLRVLAMRDGTRALEQDYHLLFAAFRLHGEWFERTPELMAEIRRLSTMERSHAA